MMKNITPEKRNGYLITVAGVITLLIAYKSRKIPSAGGVGLAGLIIIGLGINQISYSNKQTKTIK